MTQFTESLEPRRLCSSATPTANEQLVVELINRSRANPLAEAARLGIDLNEGLAAGTITSAPKQPLAIGLQETFAARGHSQWMIDNNIFSHTGANNSDPGDRMSAAGVNFVAPYTWGENIGYRAQKPTVPNETTTAAKVHDDLFIDKGIAGRGHRTDMMNPDFKLIGAGIVSGEFNTYNAVMLTTDFSKSGTNQHLLTGVAYTDVVTKDNFYTPGEGMNKVTITATRVGDGLTATTKTFTSGGYTLALSAGKWIVSATGGGFGTTLMRGAIVMGEDNVKLDFRPEQAGTVRGRIFNDANHNAIQDAGETGIPNIYVFIDTHGDGKRNRSEMYTRTNADGAYAFRNIAPSTYRVRQTLPANYALVAPTSGVFTVKLGAGKTATGNNFAAELIV